MEITGKRYNQDDPKLLALSNRLSNLLTVLASSGGLIFFFPWLTRIMPDKIGYTSVRDAFENLKGFVEEAVEEHQKTYQPDTTRSVGLGFNSNRFDYFEKYLLLLSKKSNERNTLIFTINGIPEILSMSS